MLQTIIGYIVLDVFPVVLYSNLLKTEAKTRLFSNSTVWHFKAAKRKQGWQEYDQAVSRIGRDESSMGHFGWLAVVDRGFTNHVDTER